MDREAAIAEIKAADDAAMRAIFDELRRADCYSVELARVVPWGDRRSKIGFVHRAMRLAMDQGLVRSYTVDVPKRLARRYYALTDAGRATARWP